MDQRSSFNTARTGIVSLLLYLASLTLILSSCGHDDPVPPSNASTTTGTGDDHGSGGGGADDGPNHP
ncbi:MAG: hypothetical protein ABI432_02845 [Flavobacteriales bacterium]